MSSGEVIRVGKDGWSCELRKVDRHGKPHIKATVTTPDSLTWEGVYAPPAESFEEGFAWFNIKLVRDNFGGRP